MQNHRYTLQTFYSSFALSNTLFLVSTCMPHTKKTLDNSQIELTITVLPESYQKHLLKAAVRLSERTAVKGFRKGHVPFDVMKKELGDMAILQEALESIVQQSFYDAVKEEGIETIGMPKITLEKIAPGNEVVYKAVVALIPGVGLPDLSKISVEKKKKEIKDSDIAETLDAIRGMQAKEVVKEGAATKEDKLVIDMDMAIDNVPVEGGQSKDYQVYLSEKHYIPGFAEQLVGLKKGETKTFRLPFNKEHYQKHLAGKDVDFTVKVKDVYERQLPELNDELAKSLGQKDVAELKRRITDNLTQEAEQKTAQAAEIEMLNQLIEKASFEPIPEIIIDAERQKMFYELKQDLERNGVSIEQYLADIKKDEKNLFEDFRAQAEKRAKAALLSRQIAKENNIMVTDEEMDAEIAKMKEHYKHNKEAMENIVRPEVRDTIATTLQNRKVIAWLKERVLKEEDGGGKKEEKKK